MDEVKQRRLAIRRKLRRRRHQLLAVELLQDFAKNTSLHGLRYTTERGLSLIEKLFWFITFLISLSLCLFLIRNVWVKWQTSPVIVALSEHLVFVGEVPFPSVTICPQIKAKRTVYNFSEETAKMKEQMEDMNLTLDNFEDYNNPSVSKYEDIGLICWLEDPLVLYTTRNHSDAKAIENIIEVSPNVKDIFRSCLWREDGVTCEKIFKPVLTTEGVCYTMNSLAADEILREENLQKNYSYLNTSTPSKGWSYTKGYTSADSDVYPLRGRGNGGSPDFTVILQETLADRDGLCNGISRGYKVYLQHPADMPQASLYYYTALPKETTSFALKFSVLNTSSTLRNYLPETRQCYFPDERWLKYFHTYTTNNCRLECLSNYTFEKCGCVWFHMPHDNSSTICRQAKKDCVWNALDKYATEEGLTDTKVATCSCLPSCVGIQYDAEILKTQFDTKSYFAAVRNVFPDWISPSEQNEMDETNFQLTQIDMYYKEPRFVSMRRSELFGLTDFLANCGGLLGLFLGFSFLSIVEILYFCTLRLGFTLRRDKENQRTEITVKQN